jgi:hypothetical protein
MMSEQQTRIVNYTVARTVSETGIRRVPFTTYREVPCTRTVCVPRQVPRQVTYNVCRCIPRTETYQVPCYIYKQVNCGGGKGACQKSRANEAIEAAELTVQGALPDIVNKPAAIGTEETEAASRQEVPAELVSRTAELSHEDANPALASDAFVAGLAAYRWGQFDEAIKQFEEATQAAGSNAKYAYFYALALYQTDRKSEAQKQLKTAVSLEKASPICDWGRVMERVQGLPRLWIEDARQTL